MASLAAEVAAYHRAVILFEPSEIGLSRPRILIWLTLPREVTFAGVQNIYSAARFASGSKVYVSMTGIITAKTPHDAALLIARTYAYPKLPGPWKMQLVDEVPFYFSTPRQPLGELVRLQNAARMGFDADVPRAILIGDPTFHQSESEWADYSVLPRQRYPGFSGNRGYHP